MITLLNVLSIASKDVPVPTMDSIDISKSTFNEIERRLENNRNEILAIYDENYMLEEDDVVLRETPKSRKKTNPKKANNPEKALN